VDEQRAVAHHDGVGRAGVVDDLGSGRAGLGGEAVLVGRQPRPDPGDVTGARRARGLHHVPGPPGGAVQLVRLGVPRVQVHPAVGGAPRGVRSAVGPERQAAPRDVRDRGLVHGAPVEPQHTG